MNFKADAHLDKPYDFIPISVSPLPMPKRPEFKVGSGRCIYRFYDDAYAKFMADRNQPDPEAVEAWKGFFAAEKAHYAQYHGPNSTIFEVNLHADLDQWLESAPEMKAGSKAQQEEAAKALAKYAEIYPVLKTPPPKLS